MKKILSLLGLAVISISAHAQLDLSAFQDGHNTANAARYIPTYLGDHFQKVQITVANPYLSIGSNFSTVRGAMEYFTSDVITNEMIGKTISKLKSDGNNINAAVNVALLNVAFNFTGKDGHKSFSLGFGVDERIELNTIFNKETFLLAYQGNKQFAGRTVSLTPNFNGVAFTDYYVSGALNLRSSTSDWVIKPAIRLNYYSGQASVNMRKDNAITLYTEPDGRYLDFGLNYNINTSSSTDSVKLAGNTFNVNNKSFQQGAGNGFGMDLGVRLSPKPGILINVGIMDLGSIRFTKNVVNMYNHSSYRYEGQEISFTGGQSIDLDSIGGVARTNYSHNAYTVKLPTRLIMNGSIGLNREEGNGGPWYKHQICLTYLQGFENYLSATKTPYLALGYTRSFNNVLNLGVNAGVGGISGAGIGALASVKLGFFNIGFSSSNILTLIAPNSGKASDAAMMMVFAF